MRFALAAAATLFAALVPLAAQARPCDGLRTLPLPADVRITRASDIVPEAHFMAPNIPDAKPMKQRFCRVEGVIEKEIGFELWLPESSAWNGRFLTGGVGGQAGNFNYRELSRGVRQGFASASTDTGHKASDRHWLLGDPMRAVNYAERANHLLAVKAKQIVTRFYKRAIRTALFMGCSGGGRQALTEAQRYPDDYDGILAGAPGPKTPEMSARRMWEMQQHSATASIMTDRLWGLVYQSAIRTCDPLDGVTNGVIDHPMNCPFRIASLLCSKTMGPECLTAEQVRIAERIYAPLHDETGKRIDDGLLPGVRVHPQVLPEPFTPGPAYLAVALFGDGVHRDADWDPATFRIARDLPAIDRVMNLHADDPNIRPFVSRGGKLLIYQGWSDPLVAAQPTITYYEAAAQLLGAQGQDSLRLFMIPGVDHCVGGPGTDSFGGSGGEAHVVDPGHDMLSALTAWVEQGRPPERIVAAKRVDDRVIRTRPLCAWPRVARYDGRGDSDQATSFTCELPERPESR